LDKKATILNCNFRFDESLSQTGSIHLLFDDERYAGVTTRSKCYETFCCSIRARERGDTGARQQVGGEKTQLNVGGSVGGTQFDCFFIAIILVPSLAPGNGDLTRHGILVDLYRVSLQLQIDTPRFTRVNQSLGQSDLSRH